MADCFLSCDWGTTHFRLRLVDRLTARVHREVRTDDGVARLASIGISPDERAFLLGVKLRFQAEMLLGEANIDAKPPIVISGMASSSIGWRELPYATLPFRLDGSSIEARDLGPFSQDEDQLVLLISGVRDRLDVMRGEETEAIGLAELWRDRLPDSYIAVQPGTHSKHIFCSFGNIIGFQTVMTGELFEVLRQHSVLRHSTSPEPIDFSQPSHWQSDFVAGVEATASLGMASAMFHARTRGLLDGCAPQANTAFLSGVLIGAELKNLFNGTHEDTPIIFCAGSRMAPAYQCAVASLYHCQNCRFVEPTDVDRLAILGQRRVLELLE